MRATFPRRLAAVNGCELSHPTAPPRAGNSPSTGNRAGLVPRASAPPAMPNWAEAIVIAAMRMKRRRSKFNSLDIYFHQYEITPQY